MTRTEKTTLTALVFFYNSTSNQSTAADDDNRLEIYVYYHIRRLMGAVFEDSPRLVFDFEDHVKNVILPQLGGNGIENRPRTIVCRHWLKGLCQKGDMCEYLHQMDLEKMPICKWGAECQARPNCLYRHIEDEERPECIFFRQGFCKHGPGCRYKHVKLGPDEVPEVRGLNVIHNNSFATS